MDMRVMHYRDQVSPEKCPIQKTAIYCMCGTETWLYSLLIGMAVVHVTLPLCLNHEAVCRSPYWQLAVPC